MIHRLADNSRSFFWLLNIAGWAGYAVLNYLMGISGHDMPHDYIEPSLMYAAGGLVITYGLRFVYKAAWDMPPVFSLPINGLGAIVAAALFAGFRSFVYVHIYKGLSLGTVPLSDYFYSWELTLSFYVIGTWSGLYFGIKYYRMAQQQREQVLKATNTAQEAQLRTLRFQLNPHFLFNTLNSISTLVLETENETANHVVTKLSAFLRDSLDRDPMQKISLKEELRTLDLYLGLEQLRFEDRLRVEFEIDEDAYDCLVPGMILQPLIENSMTYATCVSESGGRIIIGAKIDGAMLCLNVTDTGHGNPDDLGPRSREDVDADLANTRERLRVLYGDAHSFSVNSMKPHGLKVEVCIPRERCQS